MSDENKFLKILCIVSVVLMITACTPQTIESVRLTPPANALTECDEIQTLVDSEMGELYSAYFFLLEDYEECFIRHGSLVEWVKKITGKDK